MAIVNAGDGMHAHPTQALIDALTLREALGSLEGRVVAIVGDVAHSRVARSNLHALRGARRTRAPRGPAGLGARLRWAAGRRGRTARWTRRSAGRTR